MAEQARQEQGKDAPWGVKLTTADAAAFLEGAPGAISTHGYLDTTTTEAQRAKVQLGMESRGVVVRYQATKNPAGKGPVVTPRRRLFPWARVVWVDLPDDSAPAGR